MWALTAYTYTTTDGQGGTTIGTANVTVYDGLSVQPSALANGTVGQNYSQTLTATGGSGSPVVWTVSGFPPGGLHLSSSGVLSGTPLQSGTFTFTVNARDTGQELLSESRSYTIIVGPPVIAPSGLTNPTVNTPYSFQVFAGGATGAVTWALNTNGHPALSWLSISSTGVLSGTPTTYGTSPSFTVTATDSAAIPQIASRNYTVNVIGPLDMTPLREGIVLEGPSSISFVGGNGTRTATLTGGSLPPGLTLNANGTWTGTPTRHGTYNFTLELRDCQSGSCGSPTMVTKNISWQISAKDQQGAQGSDGTVSFGGASGRQIAQVFTVGAHGVLTGVSLSQLTCSIPQTPLTIEIQRLTSTGIPDGTTIASGTSIFNLSAIQTNPQIPVVIGEKLAFVLSSPVSCDLTNTFTGDAYNAGDAYSLVPPGNWVSLFSASSRRDVPSFRTLIHPGMPVTYHNGSRNSASATLLDNGKVLIAGGVLAAELYDPALAQTQTPASAGNMVVQRQGHTATLLTNGTVVMIGGRNAAVSGSPKVASAEIYTPGSGFANVTGINPIMAVARDNHRAARYTDPNDGREKILVTGGSNSSGATLNTTEIYDTVTKSFSTGPVMLTGRQSHAAVTLGNGKILLAGGYTSGGSAHAELYNPVTNTFAATPNMVVSNRGNVSATLLADGNVLITGGQNGDIREEAEVYNVAGNTFSSTASPMLSKRMQHSTTLLGDGSVLIVGGYAEQPQANYSLPLATMERYVPGTNSFVSAGAMETRRERAAVVTNAVPVPLAGKQLRIDYWYPAATTLMERTDAVVGSGIEAIHSQGFHVLDVDVSDGNIYIDFLQPHFFVSTSFNGFRFADYTGTIGAFTSVTLSPATNMVGLDASRISFTADEILINWQGLSFDANTIVSLDIKTATSKALIAGGTSQSWMSANTAETYDQTTSPYFTPTTPPNGSPGVPYAHVYNGQGGTGGPYTFALVGQLPPGLGFNPGGTIAGTPTTTGLYQFAIAVTDNGPHTNVQSQSLMVGTVNTITSPYRLTPDAGQGNQFTRQLTATGPNNVWSMLPAANTLPPGITLSASGLLDGIPTSTGFFNFGVRAVDNNGLGTEAIKILSISVGTPLGITTTSLGNGDLFSNNLSCISTAAGVGTRFYSIVSGTAPTGLTLSGTNNCFTGQMTATGAFTFTVRVTDSASPPQQAERSYTVDVWAPDQSVSSNGGAANLSFGTGTGVRLAQRMTTGITGTLRAVRLQSLTCNTAGTTILVEIQGLDAGGKPNGQTLAMGNTTGNTAILNTGLFFAADAPFTVIYDAAAQCAVKPNTFDSYPGQGFISNGGGAWQQLQQSPDARFDIPSLTLVEPVNGLVSMSNSRGTHTETQTLLPSGKVLIAGGNCCNAIADLYDPATNTITPAGTMNAIRQGHSATLLDNGTVLLAGGFDNTSTYLATAEIYNPATGQFLPVAGSMTTGRQHHTATLLAGGKVLIAAGTGPTGIRLNTAELFDPSNGQFTATPTNMGSTVRSEHTATLLASGKVLIAGGFSGGTSGVLYDPLAQTFTATATPMTAHRGRHTATLLGDGTVLLAGGGGFADESQSSMEIFNPAGGGSFAAAGNMTTPRTDHAAALLDDGSVLISGGLPQVVCCNNAQISTMERYVPGTGAVGAGSMIVARYAHTMTTLGNDKVLIAGTYGWSSAGGRTAEIYDPATAPPYLMSTQATDGLSGAPYSFTLTPAGGTGSGYVISHMSGALPVNLTLNGTAITGTIAGSQTGTYTPTFKIVDSGGRTSYQVVTLRVDPVAITTTSLPIAYQGVPYTGGLSGTAPTAITWSIISGSLPSGLALNASSGAITGSAVFSCCQSNFVVKAVDASGQSTIKALRINVQAPLIINNSSLWDGIAGQTYGGNLFASGGAAPYNWSISGEPVGLKINATNGNFLSNWPNDVLRQAGSFTVAAQVTDSSAPQQSASKNLALNVYAQDQGVGSILGLPDINVNAGRKIAQVFRTGTPYGVSGVQVWNIKCDAGVMLTGKVYPVTGADLPDDSGAPLRTGTLTSNVSGFFDSNNLIFSPSVSMNQAAKFSIVFSTSGHCVVKDWSQTDFYQWGNAWVDDGSGWGLAIATAGVMRADLPLTTLIEPSPSLRFLAGWRGGHASAKLNDGRVFLAGSDHRTEIYDPATNNLTLAADMSHARQEGTATLLNSGKVLVAGGNYWNGVDTATTATTQLFSPATGQFEASQSMSQGRQKHTATRLNDGRVLITGGQEYIGGSWFIRQSADLFDGNGGFIASLNMTLGRAEHTATLLNDGRVLIVGGWNNGGPSSVAEIYDPTVGANGSFSTSAAVMPGFAWPAQHTATLLTTGPRAGQVLIAGGWGSPALGASYFYDPAFDTFANAPAQLTRRLDHTATTLPNGRIVFAGGVVITSPVWTSTSLVEMYDPATDEQAYIGYLIAERNTHSADVVSTPNGPRLAVAAGYGQSNITGVSLEQFDLGDTLGSFEAAAPMTQARRSHVAVQLNNGKVLLAGSDEFHIPGAELYDPATDTTVTTGNMVSARCNGCAYAKLLNGKVLVTGGYNGPVFNTAEIYDPGTGLFTATAGNMTGARLEHSAVTLTYNNNGKVLILGGYDGTTPYASAELFDPVTGTFTATGSMASVRYRTTAIELLNGKVLVVGGFSTGSNIVTTAELYDPVAGTFSPTGSMVNPRQTEAPALLDDGRVLIAGGWNGAVMAGAEVYDPLTGTFSVVGSMTTPRSGHLAVKLENGVVVVGGGVDQADTPLSSAEMFNPTTNTFTRIDDLPSPRVNSRAIALADGRIMITGGTSTGSVRVATVDYYVP